MTTTNDSTKHKKVILPTHIHNEQITKKMATRSKKLLKNFVMWVDCSIKRQWLGSVNNSGGAKAPLTTPHSYPPVHAKSPHGAL